MRRFNVCAVRPRFFDASEHSQTRITRHPCARNFRVTTRSRSLFRESFSAHQRARFLGSDECFGCGQPCQKQPSTKTAIFSRRKIKSGFPNRSCPRRQPRIPFARNNAIMRNSVSRFPLPRIRDITADRFSGVKTSGTRRLRARKRNLFPVEVEFQ